VSDARSSHSVVATFDTHTRAGPGVKEPSVGAALAGLGVPRKSIVKYERQLKANKYLLIAHGRADEVESARKILERTAATEMELFNANGGGEA